MQHRIIVSTSHGRSRSVGGRWVSEAEALTPLAETVAHAIRVHLTGLYNMPNVFLLTIF